MLDQLKQLELYLYTLQTQGVDPKGIVKALKFTEAAITKAEGENRE